MSAQGTTVQYEGHSRPHLYDKIGVVKAEKQQYGNAFWGVEYPDFSGLEWATRESWRVVEVPRSAHQDSIAKLEAARMENLAKIAEIQKQNDKLNDAIELLKSL